jgi:hypothetical protein
VKEAYKRRGKEEMTSEIEEHNEPERERKGDPSIETSSLQLLPR